MQGLHWHTTLVHMTEGRLCATGVWCILCALYNIVCAVHAVLCQACANMAMLQTSAVSLAVLQTSAGAAVNLQLVIGSASDMVCTGQHTTEITKIGRITFNHYRTHGLNTVFSILVISVACRPMSPHDMQTE